MEALGEFLASKLAAPVIAGATLIAGLFYGLKRNNEKDADITRRVEKLEEGFTTLATQQAIAEERRQGNNELTNASLKRIEARLTKIDNKLEGK